MAWMRGMRPAHDQRPVIQSSKITVIVKIKYLYTIMCRNINRKCNLPTYLGRIPAGEGR